jgi:hypothetical protein
VRLRLSERRLRYCGRQRGRSSISGDRLRLQMARCEGTILIGNKTILQDIIGGLPAAEVIARADARQAR